MPSHRANFFDSQIRLDPTANRISIPPKWFENLEQINNELIKRKHQNRLEYKHKTTLFKAIGLCIALILVIGAFEWKFYESDSMVDLGSLTTEFEEIVEIPLTQQPPPPPPKVQVANLLEVPDIVEIEQEIELSLDVEVTEESSLEEVVYEEVEIMEEVAEEIFQFVEQSPEPVGGLKAFYAYIAKNLTYPAQARRSRVEGKVYLQFVVRKDGSITDIKVLKGIGFGCDKEAIKVLESAPKWKPGKQRGVPVNVHMSIPIIFLLKV